MKPKMRKITLVSQAKGNIKVGNLKATPLKANQQLIVQEIHGDLHVTIHLKFFDGIEVIISALFCLAYFGQNKLR